MVAIACTKTKTELADTSVENVINQDVYQVINDTLKSSLEGYTLLKNTCYACHSITSKSHDDIIAPPMVAVKRRYLRAYPEKEVFVNAMVNFAKEPTEEKALMFGAVRNFKVMSNLNHNEEDLKKIAAYIYENDLEKPEWFDTHFNEKHDGKKHGKGKGKRRRMLQGN